MGNDGSRFLLEPERSVTTWAERTPLSAWVLLGGTAAVGVGSWTAMLHAWQGGTLAVAAGLEAVVASALGWTAAIPSLVVLGGLLGSRLPPRVPVLASLVAVAFGGVAFLAAIPILWFFDLTTGGEPAARGLAAIATLAGVGLCMVNVLARTLRAAEPGTPRWRLRGIEIRLPPLRDRGDDVLLLARHFLARAPLPPGCPVPTLGPAAEEALRAHPWPGNLRELRQAVQRAAVVAGTRPVVEPADLGLETSPAPDGATLEAQVEALERRLLRGALDAEGGNRTRAARRLGLSRQGLLNKLDRYGMG